MYLAYVPAGMAYNFLFKVISWTLAPAEEVGIDQLAQKTKLTAETNSEVTLWECMKVTRTNAISGPRRLCKP